jgi:putative transcriptional regulator
MHVNFYVVNIKQGNILVSAPSLGDPNFENVVIFLAEYNHKGAMGFVINKLFPRLFNELTAFNKSKAFALYAGGPVKNEELFFIHKRPDIIDGGTLISDSIYLGGNFKKAVQHINDSTLTENDIKLFIGYCGWDVGELEEEVAEGSWLVNTITSPTVFGLHYAKLWEALYQVSA